VEVGVASGERPILSVRDHGPGLSPEDRDRAFDRFFRGGASHGTAGSGLGLAIAKVICEQHGADVTIGNGETGGTLVTVVFPPLSHPLPTAHQDVGAV
jgi:two-component system sensor histidine kinase MprB